MTTPTPRPGDWWIVRLEGRCRSHLVQVVGADAQGVTLQGDERRRYPVAEVEWVRLAPLYVTPELVQVAEP